jgi:hypothetical protein
MRHSEGGWFRCLLLFMAVLSAGCCNGGSEQEVKA